MKIISISAKCSDLFAASLIERKGKPGDANFETRIGNDYDGYVPDFFPGQHYGDYVTLDIDIATGKILNWRKPTAADLKKIFGK